MWAIKFLNGPQAGKIYPLKAGKNILGRSQTCDIQVMSAGASKEHCELTVYPDKVTVADLQSRNGTIINGVKVKGGFLRMGDKAAIHDVIFELVAADARPKPQTPVQSTHSLFNGSAAHQYNVNPAAQNYQWPQNGPNVPPQAAPQAMAPNFLSKETGIKAIIGNVQDYLERVALPGVYRLPEIAEFKWILGGFMAGLIVLVTLLCMFPAMQMSKASIMNESKRRAQSLARSLAQLNQSALLQGMFASVSTHSIENEDGVKEAFIIQQVDGTVVAPATLQGKVHDLAFIHNARKESKSQIAVIDSSTIGASFPIGVYDPSTGEPSVKYHAIIIYDGGSFSMDDGRAISLFMQTLILASIAGAILFFFMYKMIEHPISNLNQQLDTALREKKDNLTTSYQFPVLQDLVGNINSLLTRHIHGDGNQGGPSGSVSHAQEASKVVAMILEPAVVISNDGIILSANSYFEKLAQVSGDQLQNQTVQIIIDNALRENINFLISKSQENPFSMHSEPLDFNGKSFSINCQAFGQPVDYFVITATPQGG